MNVRPCALIVEDELFVALDPEDAMVEMGVLCLWCGGHTRPSVFTSSYVEGSRGAAS
jgi:hypothetical protein